MAQIRVHNLATFELQFLGVTPPKPGSDDDKIRLEFCSFIHKGGEIHSPIDNSKFLGSTWNSKMPMHEFTAIQPILKKGELYCVTAYMDSYSMSGSNGIFHKIVDILPIPYQESRLARFVGVMSSYGILSSHEYSQLENQLAS